MQQAGERADVPGETLHLTANLFAVAFGVVGLAQAWAAVALLAGDSDWPANALWIVGAVIWLITLASYLANVAAQRRWKTELSDPTFGPFTSLIVIVPMLLGTRLAQQARGAGEVVFWCSVVLVVLAGGWMTGDWIVDDGHLQRWHPGYYLPTAAGGLLAGGASAALGFSTLSHVLFGIGITSFVLLGSIIQLRLFNAPPLPPPLLPTIAIDVAPPVVAGSAWFAINGGTVDTPAAILAGLAVLLLLVEADSVVPAGAVWRGLLGLFVPFRRRRHRRGPLAGRRARPRRRGPWVRPRRRPHRRVRAARRADGRRPGQRHVPAAGAGTRPGHRLTGAAGPSRS
jgi:tellurite resistance protein